MHLVKMIRKQTKKKSNVMQLCIKKAVLKGNEICCVNLFFVVQYLIRGSYKLHVF